MMKTAFTTLAAVIQVLAFRRHPRRIFLGLVLLASLPSTAVAQMERFRPVTDERIRANAEPENWLVFRRSWNQWGNSPLDQISRENVRDLQLVWSAGMLAGRNQQEPLVVDGVMFLMHPQNEVEALDARTGESLWRYRAGAADDARQVGRTRSAAVYRDKVIFGTGDTRVIAVDARNGELAWEVDTLDAGIPRKKYDFSSGPAVGDGKVYIGSTCEVGALPPCAVMAIDLETGRMLWRRAAIAGAGDTKEDQATWGGVPPEGRRKGSFWGTGSYDPQARITYWGSASASPYPEVLKKTGSGELRWTNSTLAIRADTGELAWAFQHLPRDNWDADHMGERIYVDRLRVEPDPSIKWFNPALSGGQTRNVIWALGKPGVLWALDRDTGEFLWAKETVYQEYYTSIDGRGRPVLNESKIPTKVGEEIAICPGMRGGALWQSKSYSPATNTLFLTVHQTCQNYRIVDTDSGLDWSKMFHMPGTRGNAGKLMAIDASTGKTAWSYEQRAPMWSVLTTGGGLVFVGDNYRNFMAFDQHTGEKVWEIALSGPVMGTPISYAVDGRQYIAVTVGGGGAGGPHINAQLTPELKPRIGNNVLMVFALRER